MTPPLWNWLKARNTIYAATNLRPLVAEQLMSRKASSYPVYSLGRVGRRKGLGGTGSLVFDRTVT